MFGDVSQLPPIETLPRYAAMPSAFKVALDKFDGVRLTTVHRQAEGSLVLTNAQRINNGLGPKPGDCFKVTITDQPVKALLEAVLEAGDAFAKLDNQIITPTNKSWIGTEALNQQLQLMLMDDNRETMKLLRHKWHKQELHIGVGDKVMMTNNWYSLGDGHGVFNGETGIVTEITDYEEIIIDFDGRIVSIPPIVQIEVNNRVTVGYPQKDLQLAYAITTHKAQGSEYKHVIYVMNKSAQFNVNRRNFYTAVSRARERVHVISDMRTMGLALSQKEPRVWSK
jgi:exodeoxyribonuclease V alpha subunit